MMNQSKLLDKTFVCLPAAAIGNSMGAPVEGWHYTAIREKYGLVETLIPNLGVYHRIRQGTPYESTDDTVLRNLIVRARVKKRESDATLWNWFLLPWECCIYPKGMY